MVSSNTNEIDPIAVCWRVDRTVVPVQDAIHIAAIETSRLGAPQHTTLRSLAAAQARFRKSYDAATAVAGVIESMATLAECKDIRQVLLIARNMLSLSTRETDGIREGAGLSPFVDICFGPDDVNLSHMGSQQLIEAIQSVQARPERAVVIGDHPDEAKMAREIGVRAFIGLNIDRNPHRGRALAREGAADIVADASLIPSIILRTFGLEFSGSESFTSVPAQSLPPKAPRPKDKRPKKVRV